MSQKFWGHNEIKGRKGLFFFSLYKCVLESDLLISTLRVKGANLTSYSEFNYHSAQSLSCHLHGEYVQS